MRHKIKKTKFNFGKDANKMLFKKLAVNFFKAGYLKTTLKKAKVLKSYLEKLIFKGKRKSEYNKKYLLKEIGDLKLVNEIFDRFSPSFKNITGGYIKISKLDLRDGDGSLMAKIEWAHPILEKEEKDKDKKEIEVKNKKENKTK